MSAQPDEPVESTPLTQGEAEIFAAAREAGEDDAAPAARAVIEDGPNVRPFTDEQLQKRIKDSDPKPTGKVWRYGYLFTMIIFGVFSWWRMDYSDEDQRTDFLDGIILGIPLWAIGLLLLYGAWWMIRFVAIDIRNGHAVEGHYTSRYGRNNDEYLYKYKDADGTWQSWRMPKGKTTKPEPVVTLWVIKGVVVPASYRTSRYILSAIAILLAGGLGGVACYYAALLIPAPGVASFM